MQDQVLDEAKRQLAVCNACRYCEDSARRSRR